MAQASSSSSSSPVNMDGDHRPHPEDKPPSECPIFERGFGAFFQSGVSLSPSFPVLSCSLPPPLLPFFYSTLRTSPLGMSYL